MKIIRPANLNDGGTPFSRSSSAFMYDKTGTYVSVGNNVPRFSYDPTNLSNPPRLLVEKAATNLQTYSSQLEMAVWQKVGASVVTNSGTAPDGTATADVITFSTNAGSNWVSSIGLGTLVGTFTFSAFVNSPQQHLFAGGGVITSSQSFSAISIGGGWFRQVLTVTITSGSINPLYGPPTSVQAAQSYPYSVTVWGAQLEVGSLATSYIPTGSATASRSADVLGNNLISTLPETDAPAWSATSIYVFGDRVIYTDHTIYQSNTGSAGTVSTSVASSGAAIVVNWNAHGALAGTPVMFTSGTLPSGLSLNTVYYVTATGLAANSFELSTTANGTVAITSTTTGTLASIAARYSTNYNMTPSSNIASSSATNNTGSAVWLDAGPTNKYAITDQSIESVSSNAYELNFAFASPTNLFADSVVIKNANAQSIRVTVYDFNDGLVYDQTSNMVALIDDPDFYEYCFEPIVRSTDVMFTGLPPYANAVISVCLLDTSGTPSCGLCVIGQSKDFGPTQAGMSIGIQDFTLKSKDAFGHTDIEERPYAGTMDITAFVDRNKMTTFVNLLNSLRATPVVYIGDETQACSFQYGFFKDYTMGANYVAHSVLHLQIESLT